MKCYHALYTRLTGRLGSDFFSEEGELETAASMVDSTLLLYLCRDLGASLWQGYVCGGGWGVEVYMVCVCKFPCKGRSHGMLLAFGVWFTILTIKPDSKNFNSNTCWSCTFSTFCLTSATETSWKIEINEAKRKLMENILLYKEEKLDSIELFGPWWPKHSWGPFSSTGWTLVHSRKRSLAAQGLSGPIQPKYQPEQKETCFNQCWVAGRQGRGPQLTQTTNSRKHSSFVRLLAFHTRPGMEHLVCDPRIWVVLWFQGDHVDYHPNRCCCSSSKHSSTTDKNNPAAPMVFSRVIICLSYLLTAFCKLPFSKRPSAGVSVQLLTHLSSSRLQKQDTWQRT